LSTVIVRSIAWEFRLIAWNSSRKLFEDELEIHGQLQSLAANRSFSP
jgi:hypothetical protein